jgi:hypothetical protein
MHGNALPSASPPESQQASLVQRASPGERRLAPLLFWCVCMSGDKRKPLHSGLSGRRSLSQRCQQQMLPLLATAGRRHAAPQAQPNEGPLHPLRKRLEAQHWRLQAAHWLPPHPRLRGEVPAVPRHLPASRPRRNFPTRWSSSLSCCCWSPPTIPDSGWGENLGT